VYQNTHFDVDRDSSLHWLRLRTRHAAFARAARAAVAREGLHLAPSVKKRHREEAAGRLRALAASALNDDLQQGLVSEHSFLHGHAGKTLVQVKKIAILRCSASGRTRQPNRRRHQNEFRMPFRAMPPQTPNVRITRSKSGKRLNGHCRFGRRSPRMSALHCATRSNGSNWDRRRSDRDRPTADGWGFPQDRTFEAEKLVSKNREREDLNKRGRGGCFRPTKENSPCGTAFVERGA
jgi:hypothetical protein